MLSAFPREPVVGPCDSSGNASIALRAPSQFWVAAYLAIQVDAGTPNYAVQLGTGLPLVFGGGQQAVLGPFMLAPGESYSVLVRAAAPLANITGQVLGYQSDRGPEELLALLPSSAPLGPISGPTRVAVLGNPGPGNQPPLAFVTPQNTQTLWLYFQRGGTIAVLNLTLQPLGLVPAGTSGLVLKMPDAGSGEPALAAEYGGSQAVLAIPTPQSPASGVLTVTTIGVGSNVEVWAVPWPLATYVRSSQDAPLFVRAVPGSTLPVNLSGPTNQGVVTAGALAAGVWSANALNNPDVSALLTFKSTTQLWGWDLGGTQPGPGAGRIFFRLKGQTSAVTGDIAALYLPAGGAATISRSFGGPPTVGALVPGFTAGENFEVDVFSDVLNGAAAGIIYYT